MSENKLNFTGILEIKMFGNFDILYDNKSIFKNGKHVNRTFEILRYMIVNNDKELSPELICESIWPDKEYQDPRNTVTTYIFRLNKFLKDGSATTYDISKFLKIICQKGSYKLIISDRCLLDIKRFHNLYEQIENEENEDNKIDLMLEAISLYRGELLGDTGFDTWITPFKNYYRRIYSELSRNVLEICMNRNKYKDILKICRDIFEVYRLDEYANLYYLKSLYELNYIDEAITHYEYISSRYISELGVQPSREMREIYQKMKDKRNSNVLTDNSPDQSGYDKLFEEDSSIWKVFKDAFAEYIDKNAEVKTYSIGHITLGTGDEKDFEDAVRALGDAIKTVLRKEDCCTFFKPNIFVFVLNDFPENYYAHIRDRIINVFTRNYPKEIEFSIKINPSSSYTRNGGR